jgi:hypothetical protein
MKVASLIKALKGYEDFDVALAFENPSSTFPDINTFSNIVIWDIAYADKQVVLGPRDLDKWNEGSQ